MARAFLFSGWIFPLSLSLSMELRRPLFICDVFVVHVLFCHFIFVHFYWGKKLNNGCDSDTCSFSSIELNGQFSCYFASNCDIFKNEQMALTVDEHKKYIDLIRDWNCVWIVWKIFGIDWISSWSAYFQRRFKSCSFENRFIPFSLRNREKESK